MTPTDALPDHARAAAGRAYAPYSNFRVGAALVARSGAVFAGCNVENASYGLGACAEVGLAGQLHLGGGGRLVAIACRSGRGELLMPCGRCRQVLYEFGGPQAQLDTPVGVREMSWVLPEAFGPEFLP